MAPKRFLIIQTAFIGDVVLATALLEKLVAYYPKASIDFLVRKGNEGLLKGHPKLGNVLVWDKKGSKYRNLIGLLRRIRKSRYDVVVNVQRFAATGWLTAFSGAKETVGFDKNPWSFAFSKRITHTVSTPGKPLHEVDRNQGLIVHLTDAVPARPKLYPRAEDDDQTRPYKSSPYICIAPASVWFTKQFPADQWVTFIRRLPAHLNVYLLGGPGDHALCEHIRKQAGGEKDQKSDRRETGEPRIVNLCGTLGFLASASLQSDALMSFVNDSAPMHFSSAVNGPVTAVYCSTLPSFGFGPLSDQSHVVEVDQKLACRPCGLHGRKACPEGHFDCARKIRTDQLMRALE